MKIFIFCVFASLACVTYCQQLPKEADGDRAGCGRVECRIACWSRGYFGGMCDKNDCLCSPADLLGAKLDSLPDNAFSVYADAADRFRKCIARTCKDRCKDAGYKLGKCKFDNCICSD